MKAFSTFCRFVIIDCSTNISKSKRGKTMGAWGIKPFENDNSCDWFWDVEKTSDLSVIEAALDEADVDYLEPDGGENILAAAEMILALQGEARDDFFEDADKWVEKNLDLDASHLVEKAVQSIERVLADESELKELWEETEDYDEWLADVDDLKTALQNL